jgi:stage IV sporulation protein FB
MNVLLDCPQSRAGEWSFRLFGVPVHVKFWFWVAVVLVCGAQETAAVLIFVGVCFASILIHELGHVFAFRFFGEDAEIVLYGWGGLAVPRHDVYGTVPRIAVALAGPMAGFAVTLLTVGLAMLSDATIRLGWHLFFPVLAALPVDHMNNWYVLLNDLLWINFYWGLVNLLPVFPFDGSHVARAVLDKRRALMLSAAVAGVMTVLGLVERNLNLTLVFLVLAVSSAQAAESERGGGPPKSSYRSWRG